MVLAAACSTSRAPEGPATPPTVDGVDPAPSSADPAAGAQAAGGAAAEPASASAAPNTPAAFRSFIAALDGPSPALDTLATTADDEALTDLADEACAAVEPDMSTAELGATALGGGATLETLAPGLRPDEVSLVFGALAGLHCPERLPLSGLRIGDDREPPAGLVDGFRATVTDLWPSTHPLVAFVGEADEGRIDELASAACALASAEHTTVQFGMAVAEHRTRDLTDSEARTLGTDGHQELFGALVGWFCPERLPNPD